jgi:hypothetical protein
MENKQCSKCGVEKALCEFSKRRASPDGLMPSCKACVKDYKKDYYQKNKQKVRAYAQENKEHLSEARRRNYEKNRDKINKKRRAWRAKRKQQVRDNRREQQRRRLKRDPAFKMKLRVSSSVRAYLAKRGSSKAGKSTFRNLPYTPQELVEHLENQFDEQMSWENHGSYWEVDHIYPQSRLPFTSMEDDNFQKCWALENLQPLEKSANRRKSNKILDD